MVRSMARSRPAIAVKGACGPGPDRAVMTRSGVDRCRHRIEVAVDADQKIGSSRGVTSTPTLFVNGVALPADQLNPASVHKAIETALNEKPKP